ncbi:MAG: GWxTD domain-containing protein [Candidatus Acidiferrales bacterium]
MKRYWSTHCCALLLSGVLCAAVITARHVHASQTESAPITMFEMEVSAFPCFGAQDQEHSEKREREAIERLPEIARYWLTEDAACIISREERSAFLHLSTDREREEFIEQFWARRAPNPKSLTNSFKQEHYERIVFADQKFGTRTAGFATDRGRIYVAFGPPDSIHSQKEKGKIGRQSEKGAGANGYSKEVWHYSHIENVGDNVDFEFVDRSGSGAYRLAAPSEMEIDERLIGMPTILGLAVGQGASPVSAMRPVVRLYIGVAPTPVVQFKDLQVMLDSRVNLEQVHFNYRIKFARATHARTLAKIVIQVLNEQIASKNNRGESSKGFEVFCRISRPDWVVDTFERRINRDGQCSSDATQRDCEFNVPITPGAYRLAIAVKNVADGEVGTLHATISVPSYDEINIAKP